MENAIAPWSIGALREGVLAVPLSDGVRNPQIAIDSIGEYAVMAIEQPERLRGQRIDIATDELTGPESAAILSRASSRQIRYQAVPLEAVRAQSEDLGLMFEYFEKKAPRVNIKGLKADYPEVHGRTYEEWANGQDWDRIFAHAAGR